MLKRRLIKSENDEYVLPWQSKYSQHTYVVTEQSSPARGKIRRIVLIGKTGSGKSTTGNTILGCKKTEDRKFMTTAGLASKKMQCQKFEAERFGKRLVVVDTPGLFDTNSNESSIKEEVGRCVCMSEPGPHVFLLVVPLGKRYTNEEKQTIVKIQEMFGEMARRYTLILFTGMDNLEHDGETLGGLLDNDTFFRELVDKFGNNYHGFNNRKDDDEQVKLLMDKIENVLMQNGGHFYTNEMYETASRELHMEIEEILRKRLPDILQRESQLQHAKDIDDLWCKEVKKATQEATGIVATMWRNKEHISLGALIGGGVGLGAVIWKSGMAGFATAGPAGAVAGVGIGAVGVRVLCFPPVFPWLGRQMAAPLICVLLIVLLFPIILLLVIVSCSLPSLA